MSVGSAVWLALGVALAALLAMAPASNGKVPTLAAVLRWSLESWAGRIAMLAIWAEVGFHVFTQRP